jgi:DNA modification methylase
MDSDDNSRRAGLHKGRADGRAAPTFADAAPYLRRPRNRDRNRAAGFDEKPTLGTRGGKLSWVPINEVIPDPRNPRRHTRTQIRKLAASIATFGFNAPILVDRQGNIIAGHGRYEAARLLALKKIPVIYLDHLSEAQALAYMLADNKLSDLSVWDDAVLALHLKELSELALDFDFETIGFELPEVDFRIQSLASSEEVDRADEFNIVDGPAVSKPGDLWLPDEHRVYCGSALEAGSYDAIRAAERAAGVFTDPPYNVKIHGNACGLGAIKHREFAMAAGEMTPEEFTLFLTKILTLICAHATPGATIYVCMDWRHISELLAAGHASGCETLNVCVWVKSNGGMGSYYRSRHEFIFVFRNGSAPHLNNVQLGRFGRNRTNVWHYPGANSFPRKGRRNHLDLHPTVKPIAMVADAILDSTNLRDIILDPFLGSGTTLLAAERTGRRCHAIELDPLYVDTAILRWEKLTGRPARHASGRTFAEVRDERVRNR